MKPGGIGMVGDQLFQDFDATASTHLEIRAGTPINLLRKGGSRSAAAVNPKSASRQSRSNLRGDCLEADDTHQLPHLALLTRSEEHTSELQSRLHLVCRLLFE